jgi:nicotinamidase-related amidase
MSDLKSIVLAPERTVVLVIDMQNETCSPGGIRYSPRIEALIAPIKLLLDRSRKNRVPIIWSHSVRTHRETAVTVFNHDRHLEEGSRAAEIAPALMPRPDDVHVYKYTHDIWWKTDLEAKLEGRDPVDTNVIVTGIAAAGCVNFAVMGLHLRDYWTFVAIDCIDDNAWARKQFALEDFYNVFLTRSDLINFGPTQALRSGGQ